MTTNSAHAARVRTFTQLIRSEAVSGGAGSPFARLRPECVESAAEHIAGSNAYEHLDREAFRRALIRYLSGHPEADRSQAEIAAEARSALFKEANRHINVTNAKEALRQMTPKECLDYQHGLGLPPRFVLTGATHE